MADLNSVTVDETAGILGGVLLLTTAQRREQRNVPEFENTVVAVDDSTGPLKNDEAIGVIRNCRDGKAGTIADVHVLRRHPLAKRIFESVKRGLNLFGIQTRFVGGRPTINLTVGGGNPLAGVRLEQARFEQASPRMLTMDALDDLGRQMDALSKLLDERDGLCQAPGKGTAVETSEAAIRYEQEPVPFDAHQFWKKAHESAAPFDAREFWAAASR